MGTIKKTKKCNWCEKRKLVEDGYIINLNCLPEKPFFICDKCNLKHKIV